jgi:hypothetical protein
VAADDPGQVRLVGELVLGGQGPQAPVACLEAAEHGPHPQLIAVEGQRPARDLAEDPAQMLRRAAREPGQLLDPGGQVPSRHRLGRSGSQRPVRRRGGG